MFDLPDEKEKQGEAILNYLKTTNYGRCVYQMENDQADHYTANIEFEEGITAAFSMEALPPGEVDVRASWVAWDLSKEIWKNTRITISKQTNRRQCIAMLLK